MRYAPVAKVGRDIPWGYFQHPRDPQMLIPDEDLLVEMSKAFMFLDECSLRDVAEWLSARTGHRISAEGLRKARKARRSDGSLRRSPPTE